MICSTYLHSFINSRSKSLTTSHIQQEHIPIRAYFSITHRSTLFYHNQIKKQKFVWTGRQHADYKRQKTWKGRIETEVPPLLKDIHQLHWTDQIDPAIPKDHGH